MNTETDEIFALIASDKVEGTPVYGADGPMIGSIERVMIEKVSGRVSYAVLSFGGFFGIGHDYYPIPWAALTYDELLEGYRIAITREQLEGAPKYLTESEWNWVEHGKVDDYYRVIFDPSRQHLSL